MYEVPMVLSVIAAAFSSLLLGHVYCSVQLSADKWTTLAALDIIPYVEFFIPFFILWLLGFLIICLLKLGFGIINTATYILSFGKHVVCQRPPFKTPRLLFSLFVGVLLIVSLVAVAEITNWYHKLLNQLSLMVFSDSRKSWNDIIYLNLLFSTVEKCANIISDILNEEKLFFVRYALDVAVGCFFGMAVLKITKALFRVSVACANFFLVTLTYLPMRILGPVGRKFVVIQLHKSLTLVTPKTNNSGNVCWGQLLETCIGVVASIVGVRQSYQCSNLRYHDTSDIGPLRTIPFLFTSGWSYITQAICGVDGKLVAMAVGCDYDIGLSLYHVSMKRLIFFNNILLYFLAKLQTPSSHEIALIWSKSVPEIGSYNGLYTGLVVGTWIATLINFWGFRKRYLFSKYVADSTSSAVCLTDQPLHDHNRNYCRGELLPAAVLCQEPSHLLETMALSQATICKQEFRANRVSKVQSWKKRAASRTVVPTKRGAIIRFAQRAAAPLAKNVLRQVEFLSIATLPPSAVKLSLPVENGVVIKIENDSRQRVYLQQQCTALGKVSYHQQKADVFVKIIKKRAVAQFITYLQQTDKVGFVASCLLIRERWSTTAEWLSLNAPYLQCNSQYCINSTAFQNKRADAQANAPHVVTNCYTSAVSATSIKSSTPHLIPILMIERTTRSAVISKKEETQKGRCMPESGHRSTPSLIPRIDVMHGASSHSKKSIATDKNQINLALGNTSSTTSSLGKSANNSNVNTGKSRLRKDVFCHKNASIPLGLCSNTTNIPTFRKPSTSHDAIDLRQCLSTKPHSQRNTMDDCGQAEKMTLNAHRHNKFIGTLMYQKPSTNNLSISTNTTHLVNRRTNGLRGKTSSLLVDASVPKQIASSPGSPGLRRGGGGGVIYGSPSKSVVESLCDSQKDYKLAKLGLFIKRQCSSPSPLRIPFGGKNTGTNGCNSVEVPLTQAKVIPSFGQNHNTALNGSINDELAILSLNAMSKPVELPTQSVCMQSKGLEPSHSAMDFPCTTSNQMQVASFGAVKLSPDKATKLRHVQAVRLTPSCSSMEPVSDSSVVSEKITQDAGDQNSGNNNGLLVVRNEKAFSDAEGTPSSLCTSPLIPLASPGLNATPRKTSEVSVLHQRLQEETTGEQGLQSRPFTTLCAVSKAAHEYLN